MSRGTACLVMSCAVFVSGCLVRSAAAQARYYSIEPPTAGVYVALRHLSSDGTSAAGSYAIDGHPHPVRWNLSSGSIDLAAPSQAGDASSVAGAGHVVVGFGTVGTQLGPWKWSAETGIVPLPAPPDGGLVIPWGVSEDGLVVTGILFNGAVGAFRWTEGMGYQSIPPAGTNTIGRAISADGSTVVGLFGSGGTSAFLWRSDRGTIALPLVFPDFPVYDRYSVEFAPNVSYDGRFIAGACDGAACVYDALTDSLLMLERPNGSPVIGRGVGVSADGSIVVGERNENRQQNAFIWDAEHGARDLADVLRTEHGLNVGPLRNVIGVSADGGVIAGTTWVVTLWEPQPYRGRPACQGDVDSDQRVGLSDLLFVLGEWRRPEPDLAADITGDGIVDALDLNIVLVDFGDDCARRRVRIGELRP
ncbi:MAG: hypothetical protein IT450_22970 [Phycisphaerales bacterium]|nr:hypothetical protein [Phycisphaerales bacterium]